MVEGLTLKAVSETVVRMLLIFGAVFTGVGYGYCIRPVSAENTGEPP